MAEYQKPPKREKKPKKPLARGNKPLKRVALRKSTKPIKKSPTRALMDKRKRDKELNDHIWSIRRHVCVECGFDLERYGKKPPKIVFSHVLSKGSHPELRFDEDNIVLHCKTCHQKWEFGGNRENMETYRLKLPYMQQHGYTPKD